MIDHDHNHFGDLISLVLVKWRKKTKEMWCDLITVVLVLWRKKNQFLPKDIQVIICAGGNL